MRSGNLMNSFQIIDEVEQLWLAVSIKIKTKQSKPKQYILASMIRNNANRMSIDRRNDILTKLKDILQATCDGQ